MKVTHDRQCNIIITFSCTSFESTALYFFLEQKAIKLGVIHISCHALGGEGVWRSIREYYENCDKSVILGGGERGGGGGLS